MKKILTILLMIVSLSSFAQTSVYHVFPDSNAFWNYHYYYYCYGGQGGSITSNYLFKITGDTTINGTDYKKLYKHTYSYYYVGVCYSFPSGSGYKGAFREDIANKKVYFLERDSATEKLLFDFNLQVGDTIFGLLDGSNPDYSKIASIDSISIGSDYRKRWITISGFSIIEGIGSTYGLIEKFDALPNPPGYPSNPLSCFIQDGNLLYTFGTYPCLTPVNESTVEETLAKIYPNPSYGEIFFEYKTQLPETIRIFNASGKLVKIYFGKTDKIDISHLGGGLFLVDFLYPDGRHHSQRIILMNR